MKFNTDIATTIIGLLAVVLAILVVYFMRNNPEISGDVVQVGVVLGGILTALLGYFSNKQTKDGDA